MGNRLERSGRLFEEATSILAGGVNSPVRAFGAVGGTPVFIDRAQGAYLWDVDGNRYIDYVGSWGPAILGHAHSEVLEAVHFASAKGLTFGAPTAAETELARALQAAIPSLESMRLVSSGTEACMSALRVARGFTGRSKIVKFEGCYHGHADMLLVKAGSGQATLGLPDSPGVPAAATQDTLVATYNSLDSVEAILKPFPDEIAAIIVEPLVGNGGFIKPQAGFLEGLRAICDRIGALLIFDEVMTGFRVGWGGMQVLKGLRPDLTTLAKVAGGGLPLGVYGGKKEIMNQVAPAGPIYQAGTLSGNPVAVAAGLKTLEILERPGTYDALSGATSKLVKGLSELAEKHKIPFMADSEGGMYGFFFRSEPVLNFSDAKDSNQNAFKAFFHGMLDRGIYLAPSPFEAGFVSTMHSGDDLEATLTAADAVFATLER